jgi:hypothetical protein
MHRNQRRVILGRATPSGVRKRDLISAVRKPSRLAVSARVRVLRELLDAAHARIRGLERALERFTSKL